MKKRSEPATRREGTVRLVGDVIGSDALPVDGDGGWHLLLLTRIGNFEILRRTLGVGRARTMLRDLADRLGRTFPFGQASIVGRDSIELSLRALDRAMLERSVTTVERMFDDRIELDGESLRIDIVIGAAVAPPGYRDETALIEEAEACLVDALRNERSVLRDVRSGSAIRDRITLARDLHGAIERSDLILHYQPKVSVRRQEICSLEALIRWQHPVRGLIYPNDFIPIAEESRDIAAMTLWTIRQVIADQRRLRAHGHDLRIFINIAGMLLSDERFIREASRLVRSCDVAIGFEVTETSVIRDPERAIANLKFFADIGIVVAIDDYGAGLSSLAYLKQLPARELKIDKLFVTQLTSSNRDPLIVRSTIDLAHAMEMEVVAEGVETPAALALLSVMGCDMVQGFLISRPVAIDRLLTFLAADRTALFESTRMTFGTLAALKTA